MAPFSPSPPCPGSSTTSTGPTVNARFTTVWFWHGVITMKPAPLWLRTGTTTPVDVAITVALAGAGGPSAIVVDVGGAGGGAATVVEVVEVVEVVGSGAGGAGGSDVVVVAGSVLGLE